METWNIFYGNDLVIGLLGTLGLLSGVAVVYKASANTTKRELVLKAKTKVKLQKKIDDALNYDTYSK